MVRPTVEEYVKDETLRRGSDLMFSATIREKKVVTQNRRAVTRGNPANDTSKKKGIGSFSTITFNTIASSTSGTNNTISARKSLGDGNWSVAAEEKQKPSSGSALAKIKDIMGARPKLLAAILNMLIAEHGSVAVQEQSTDNSSLQHANMICTRVADIPLSYGQLPEPMNTLISWRRFLTAQSKLEWSVIKQLLKYRDVWGPSFSQWYRNERNLLRRRKKK